MALRAALLATLAMLLGVSSAQAVIPPGNLIPNSGGEDGPGAANERDVTVVPSWQTIPNFTAAQYGTAGIFPSATVSAAIEGGQNFFAGGPDNNGGGSVALQQIDLSQAAPEIDAGGEQMTISAFLGGFAGQDDTMTLTVLFEDANGEAIGGDGIAGPSPIERDFETRLLRRSKTVTAPPGTRRATVAMTALGSPGRYISAYADNVNLSFGADPGPPPDFMRTASVVPRSGFILVRERGSRQFRPIQEGEELNLGFEVDATNGEVQVTTAANASGETQSGAFGGGAFTTRQVGGANPVTELNMTRGTSGVCRAGGARAAARRIRRLRGSATGRFRTRGRHSSATVRGTDWSVEDQCGQTVTRVTRGVVIVHDFARRKRVRLRAGRRYVAKARRRRR